MAIVTDPDNLDRFQVIFNHVDESISVRGQDTGNIRGVVSATGESNASTTFTDTTTNDFVATSVAVGDILSIISDPDEDGGIMGHYVVQSITDADNIVVDRSIPENTGADNLTYRITAAPSTGTTTQNVADGVVGQTLYSFAKEEWRTLAAGIGNAEDLIQYNFPLVSITREQFEIGDAAPTRATDWDFADQTSRDLLRTMGYSFVDSNGDTKQIYSGIITLGSLDSDAQAYFQQHDADTDPADFVLTGAVNQSVNVFDEITGPDGGTGFAITVSNTITRNDGGNWATDGYEPGGLITIRAAEDAGNNGTFTISTVADAVDGALVVEGTPLTNNAADTTMVAAVDKRQFLVLRARKKARTYPEADLADIGVSVLENIVNRFPLSHTVDAGITFRDGEMTGDGTNTVFGGAETHTTGSDGATSTLAADGTFTLTSAGSTFNSTKTGGNIILQPGDNLELTSGSDQGDYEIKSVDSATVLTVFVEPGTETTFTGSENTLNFTVRTKTRDSGDTGVAITYSDQGGGTGRIDDTGATFNADNGIGDRTVAVDDIVIIRDGAEPDQVVGAYKVSAVNSATQIDLDISDADWTGITGSDAANDYIILRPSMHLQFKNDIGADETVNLTFNDDDAGFNNNPTIVRATGSWVTQGYVVGGAVEVQSGPTNAANIGTFIIRSIGGGGNDTLELQPMTPLLVDEGPVSCTFNSREGFIRTLNSESYSFNWRLFGNGATLSQAFQFIQRELRRGRQGSTAAEADIDLANTVNRGDITDLLMAFTAPNGTMFNTFIDDLASGDFNNVTKQDITGVGRQFAFTAGVTISLNANILNDQSAKVIVYFETNPGGNFGTNDAIIVENGDGTGSPTVMRAITGGGGDNATISATLNFTFDYDNNAQGGRTPGTDADIVIVAIGEDQAQYIQTTGTIERINNNPFSLVAALERNFSNPV